jgi:hypothetical protein
MTFYAGARDERPVGGGSYNKKNVGSELFNFKPVGKYLYGYVKGGSGQRALNLKRIDPMTTTDSLKHVTVIFVARDPGRRGQSVIGWYQDATVFGAVRIHPLKTDLKKRVYCCLQGEVAKACLLPTSWRNREVPIGKGGMGQSNVCYAGVGRTASWMKSVLKYVHAYGGPNLLREKDKPEQADQSELVESVIETAAGFESNPKIRRAIEDWAMQSAREHYRAKKFTTQDILKPYDLLCIKGKETKFVEVKGTRTNGSAVALTKNEVGFLNSHSKSSALFILHSVKLRPGKEPRAYGGDKRLIEPWDSSRGVLTPISYFFKLHNN